VLLVIGLDCAAPSLVFDRLRPYLPSLSSIASRGTWGPLRSTVPPITVPAWACMVSGRDPGELGIYGFRDREVGSRRLRTVTADDVREPRVWDVLGRAGKRSSVMYVPPTWPPRAIENGEMVSCLLTPGPDAEHTHPRSLAGELARDCGPHVPDVERGASIDETIASLHDAAARHFDVAEHRLAARPDFAMMVEIGTDRLHHAAWPALDPSDPRHDARSPLVRDARDYYAYVDGRIGRLVELAGRDATVMVVSDHGARPLRGGFRVNEWLRREGWLVTRGEPRPGSTLAEADVDWSRTRAWAEGGYYARIVMNVRERFGDGAISEVEREAEIGALSAAIEHLSDARGAPMRNRVVRPGAAFRAAKGSPPDLMVFFGDLDLRALAEVGGERLFVGPGEAGRGLADGCNHDWDGMFAIAGPEVGRGRRDGASIHDVGATILRTLGVAVPEGWLGRDLRELPS
jgi:predicted AlkP superfamily phosphohydrolase/phosphomutase